jgi:hypothetical protein
VLYAFNRRVRVQMGSEADVTPRLHLPDLPATTSSQPQPDDGPVLIQIEYQIDAPKRQEFLRAIRAVEATRRRNGAESWRVYRDIAAEGRFVERFVLSSWSEYVRLRTRMTMSDLELQDHAESLQRPDVPIRVSRLIGVAERDLL